jgi:hypothetical protein
MTTTRNLLCIAFAMTVALTALPLRAQSATDWEVDKMPDRCFLHRTWAEPTPGSLSISIFPGSDYYDVVLAAPKMPISSDVFWKATIVFHGPETRLSLNARQGSTRGPYPVSASFGISATQFADFARSSAISFTIESTKKGPFPLPDAAEALAALQECTGEHLVALGADPKQFQPGGAPPVPLASSDTWVDGATVQKILREAGTKPVDKRFKLGIDAAGRVESCVRMGAGAIDEIDKLTCGAIKDKTLFKPAHDPAGNSVRSVATLVQNYFLVKTYL